MINRLRCFLIGICKKIVFRFFYICSKNYKALYCCDLTNLYLNRVCLKKINFDDKVILFIFAGRQDRMSLLMKHVSDLLEKKLVDYVHIWNFSRNDRDFHWVKSLEDKENNIYVFSPANYGKYIRFPYLLYKLAYKLYSRQNFQYAKFIKVDDDIVFMDIAKGVFTDFIKQIEMIGHGSSHYMVSANVINNGVCAYYQQNRYNLIPEDIGKFAFPYDNSISGFAVQNYWNSGEKSEKLHHFFIQNREVFLGKLKTINPEKVEVKIGARFSTNFIGFKQQAILKYVSSGVADDEKYLTADLSKELGKHVQIFMPFVVSHLSYYSQGLQDDKALLDKYKMIK